LLIFCQKTTSRGNFFKDGLQGDSFLIKYSLHSLELEEEIVSITKDTKEKLIAKFQINKKDTGSSEVQVSVLTERIRNLTEHFKTHKKDNHSRKGLLTMVSTRKKLLNYLRRTNYDKYLKVIQELELRK